MRRLFDSKVLERLAVIALGRAAGFSLEEIAQSLLPDGGFRIERARLTAKARELDRTIQRLTAIRDDLRHAAACPAPTYRECPNFQRFVQLAGAGRFDPHERKLSRLGQGDSHWTASAAQPELKRRRRTV